MNIDPKIRAWSAILTEAIGYLGEAHKHQEEYPDRTLEQRDAERREINRVRNNLKKIRIGLANAAASNRRTEVKSGMPTAVMLMIVSAVLCLSAINGCIVGQESDRLKAEQPDPYAKGFDAGVEATRQAYDHALEMRLQFDGVQRLQERIHELPIIERRSPPVMEEVPAPEGDTREIPVTVPTGRAYTV
jgi:hypothetical protein